MKVLRIQNCCLGFSFLCNSLFYRFLLFSPVFLHWLMITWQHTLCMCRRILRNKNCKLFLHLISTNKQKKRHKLYKNRLWNKKTRKKFNLNMTCVSPFFNFYRLSDRHSKGGNKGRWGCFDYVLLEEDKFINISGRVMFASRHSSHSPSLQLDSSTNWKIVTFLKFLNICQEVLSSWLSTSLQINP